MDLNPVQQVGKFGLPARRRLTERAGTGGAIMQAARRLLGGDSDVGQGKITAGSGTFRDVS